MHARRLLSLALSLVLVLASSAGLAGHDHATEIDRASYDCALDHAGGHDAGRSAPAVHAGGEPHRHDCLACHQTGHRLILAAAGGTAEARSTAVRSIEIRTARPTSGAWTGRTLRGPPRT